MALIKLKSEEMFVCVCVFMLCSSISLSEAEELENLLCFGSLATATFPADPRYTNSNYPTCWVSLSLSLSDNALLLHFIQSHGEVNSPLFQIFSVHRDQLHMCSMILYVTYMSTEQLFFLSHHNKLKIQESCWSCGLEVSIHDPIHLAVSYLFIITLDSSPQHHIMCSLHYKWH